MKKSIIYTIGLSAIFCACLTLQSCADTSTETTYTTSSDPYYYGPTTTTETTTTTTTTAEPEPDHDSVVGSTAHAAGTIIAAPFRLVGDALSIVF